MSQVTLGVSLFTIFIGFRRAINTPAKCDSNAIRLLGAHKPKGASGERVCAFEHPIVFRAIDGHLQDSLVHYELTIDSLWLAI